MFCYIRLTCGTVLFNKELIGVHDTVVIPSLNSVLFCPCHVFVLSLMFGCLGLFFFFTWIPLCFESCHLERETLQGVVIDYPISPFCFFDDGYYYKHQPLIILLT